MPITQKGSTMAVDPRLAYCGTTFMLLNDAILYVSKGVNWLAEQTERLGRQHVRLARQGYRLTGQVSTAQYNYHMP